MRTDGSPEIPMLRLRAPSMSDRALHLRDAERERLIADFAITFNGRHYKFNGYRYDLLADAINYAVRDRSKHQHDERGVFKAAPDVVEIPSEAQQQLMVTLTITFDKGVYHLGVYRYDRLADAIDYARHHFQVGEAAIAAERENQALHNS